MDYITPVAKKFDMNMTFPKGSSAASRVFDRKCANKTKKAPMGALFFCQH